MANKHGVKTNVAKKQQAARKKAGNKKKVDQRVEMGNENSVTRKNQSYKTRKHYFENKQKWPSKKLPTKNIDSLIEMGIIDERGFFRKGKKKNFITKSMVDINGVDFYGINTRSN